MKQYKVAIIGCGVAGMTAAIYLARSSTPCCIIEGNIPGGQIIDNGAIENYPGFESISGSQLALNILKQVTQLKVPVLYQKIIDIELKENQKILHGEKEDIIAEYVIIATGRHPRQLEIENENRFRGQGISYCAVCDGTLYKNKNVLVIGGSNSAFEAALYLSKFAKHVTLLHRRNTYRAQSYLIDKAKKSSNIIFETGEVMAFQNEKDIICGVELKDGRTLAVDGIFIYIGQNPSTQMFESLGICDEAGYIKVDCSYQTNIDGIYAIGDCIAKEDYQIVIAMGEAAHAALAIARR